MGFRPGETVIVTTPESNQVGVVLNRYVVSKQTVYDVLLESRTALIMLPTAPSKNTYINKSLTSMLVASGQIECTVPYKTLLAEEQLPICHA